MVARDWGKKREYHEVESSSRRSTQPRGVLRIDGRGLGCCSVHREPQFPAERSYAENSHPAKSAHGQQPRSIAGNQHIRACSYRHCKQEIIVRVPARRDFRQVSDHARKCPQIVDQLAGFRTTDAFSDFRIARRARKLIELPVAGKQFEPSLEPRVQQSCWRATRRDERRKHDVRIEYDPQKLPRTPARLWAILARHRERICRFTRDGSRRRSRVARPHSRDRLCE